MYGKVATRGRGMVVSDVLIPSLDYDTRAGEGEILESSVSWISLVVRLSGAVCLNTGPLAMVDDFDGIPSRHM